MPRSSWYLLGIASNRHRKKVNIKPPAVHSSPLDLFLYSPKDSNMAPADSAKIQEAKKLVKTDPRKAEEQYKAIISKPPSVTSEAAIREYETALVNLGELYRDEKKANELVDLITTSRTVLSSFAKAKTAKLG